MASVHTTRWTTPARPQGSASDRCLGLEAGGGRGWLHGAPSGGEAWPHLTTSLYVRRLSLSSNSVRSLWSWLWIWMVAVRKVFVTVYNRETARVSVPFATDGLANTSCPRRCISAVRPTGSPALFFKGLGAVTSLQNMYLGSPGPWVSHFCNSSPNLLS